MRAVGTVMPGIDVSDPEVRKTLVLLIEELATRKEIPPFYR